MASGKIDRRIRNTQALLRTTLIDLMQDKPISRISVKEICEKAGINRGTFYAHYTDAQDLQEQVFADFLARVGELMDGEDCVPGSPDTVAHLARILRYIYENRRLVLTLLGENSSISSQDTLLRFMQERHSFEYFPGIPPELAAYTNCFVSAGYLSLILQWLSDGAQSPETIAQLILYLTVGSPSLFPEN